MLGSLRFKIEQQVDQVLADIPSRFQPLVILGLFAALLAIFWFLFPASLSSSREALSRQLADKEQDLAWMRDAAVEVKKYIDAGAGNTRGVGSGSPLAAIDGSARQSGLGRAMQRVEPAGNREVRVWMEDADFDDMLLWLVRLQLEHGIEVVEIVVEPGRTGVGLVNSRIILVRE